MTAAGLTDPGRVLEGIRLVARAARLTDAELAEALAEHVWGEFPWHSLGDALVAEAIRRLTPAPGAAVPPPAGGL